MIATGCEGLHRAVLSVPSTGARPLIAEYYQRVFGEDLPESVVEKA